MRPLQFLRERFGALAALLAICILCGGMTATALFADPGDDDEDSEAEVEIPPPPRDNLSLAADVAPEVKKEFEAAFAFYETARKDFDEEDARKEAIRGMTRLKAKLPGGQAHFYLGIMYQWEQEQKKARKVLEELLAAHPEFYEAHVELGDVEVQERKLEAAIPHYERALAIYPWFEYGVDRMLYVLVQLGRFAEAKPFLERALARGGNPLRNACKEAVDFETQGPGWATTYTRESENYVVKTDHSQEFADEISNTAELIRDLYDALFPDIEKPARKYLVIVHKDRQGYLDSGGKASSAGHYKPFSRRLVLYRDENLGETMKTLKHEGFHQYCHDYLDNIPQWFNEGLGDYFGPSELVMVAGKRMMRIRPDKGRMGDMMFIFRERVPMPTIPQLMQMSQAEMYDIANGGRMGAAHYAQAWSVVYFCIEGGDEGRRNALKNYFKALRQGKSQRAAYETTFGRFDMKKFEEEWRRFLQKTASEDPGI